MTTDAIVSQAIYTRHYAEAIETVQTLLAKDKAAGSEDFTSSVLNLYLADLRRLSGDTAGAKANYILVRDELLPNLERQPGNTWFLSMTATMYCDLGERKLALEYADRLVKLVPVAKDALEGPSLEGDRARIWARCGDRARAITAIARLLKLPGGILTPAILRLDPAFDQLRGDPRFEALLK
jgi:tetratricopeptide (TPR) repeat protein